VVRFLRTSFCCQSNIHDPGPFMIKPRQLSEGEVFRGLGAIERKLKTSDTRRVEASSRGRERGGGQSARRSHGENIFHAPSQPNSNDHQTTISVLSLFRSWVTSLQASWCSLILDGHSSSLCAQDSNNKSSFVDNSQRFKSWFSVSASPLQVMRH